MIHYSPSVTCAALAGFVEGDYFLLHRILVAFGSILISLLVVVSLTGSRSASGGGSNAIPAKARESLLQQCGTEEAIGIDPDHNVAYVPIYKLDGRGNAQLAVVDLHPGVTNPLIKTISLPGALIPQSVAYNPNNKTVLATGLANLRVFAYEIDAPSQSLKNVVALPGLFALTPNGGIVEDPKLDRALVGTSGFLGVLDTSRSPPVWVGHPVGLRGFSTESITLNLNTGLAFVTAQGISAIVNTRRDPFEQFAFQIPPNEGIYESSAFDITTNILVESLENGADLAYAYNFATLDTQATPNSANSVAVAGLGFVPPVGDGPGGLVAINCTTHQALVVDKFGQNFRLIQLPGRPVSGNHFLNNNGRVGSGTKSDGESVYTIAAALIPKGIIKGAAVQLGVLGMPPGIAIDPARNVAYMLADTSPGRHRWGNSTAPLFLLSVDLSKPVFGAGPTGGVDGKTFWHPASSIVRLP